jgi:hypothetical protein
MDSARIQAWASSWTVSHGLSAQPGADAAVTPADDQQLHQATS